MDTEFERQPMMKADGLILRESSVVKLAERPKKHGSEHHQIQRGRSQI
jgi:hypothetical protein